MEVKVDPMLILQCSLYDDDSSDTWTDSESIVSQKRRAKDDDIDKLYNCNTCRKFFNTDSDLQSHTSNHLSQNRILQNNHKNIKVEDVEDDAKPIKNIEERPTSTASSSEGESSENTNLLRYTCPICSKIISTKGNLKVHLETHRPKGKYACDICGRMLVFQFTPLKFILSTFVFLVLRLNAIYIDIKNTTKVYNFHVPYAEEFIQQTVL